MVDDIASDSESKSITNNSKASSKCESPGNTNTQIVDDYTEAQYQKLFQDVFQDVFDAVVKMESRYQGATR